MITTLNETADGAFVGWACNCSTQNITRVKRCHQVRYDLPYVGQADNIAESEQEQTQEALRPDGFQQSSTVLYKTHEVDAYLRPKYPLGTRDFRGSFSLFGLPSDRGFSSGSPLLTASAMHPGSEITPLGFLSLEGIDQQ